MINALNIKEMALSEGIDLVGIASVNDLLLAAPPRPASYHMPGAKSVIVMAVAHSLGAVYSPDIMLWTRNKMQTSRILDQTAEKISRNLEKNGYLALPVSSDKPVEIITHDHKTGKRLRRSRVVGHLSLKHAALSCGMGEIGRNNLLLTPEFGPHQRICSIITEAELEPDPPKQHSLCLKCGRCESACPSGALSGGSYSFDPCFMYWTYGLKKLPPSRLLDWPGFIRTFLAHANKRDLIVEMGQTFITDVDHCLECMRACPVGSRWKKIRPTNLPLQKSGGTCV